MMLLAAGLTGCGKAAVEEETPEISAAAESGEGEENTDIEETADTGKEEVEEPEENANEDGYVYYSDHGLSYSAMVFSGLGSSSYLELSLKDSVEYDLDE